MLKDDNGMNNGFIKSEISQYLHHCQQWSPNSLPSEIFLKKYLKSSRQNMKRRCIKYRSKLMINEDDVYFYCDCIVPTYDQLMDIIIKSNGLCSISGIPGIWCCTDQSNLSRLTFDHIVPVSKEGSFGKDNIQAANYRFNRLKGNESDSEVTRFLTGFRNNHYH